MKSVDDAARKLDLWIEREEYRGWDPHDALNSPLLCRLFFGRHRLGIVWVQLLRRCPINPRPLLGIGKGYNPKAMGLFLASYVRKYRLTSDPRDLDRAHFFLDWLREYAQPGYAGACWGYNFDWPNRGFFAPAGTPTIVNTAFIGLALLDAHRLLPKAGHHGAGSGTDVALPLARSACDFLLQDLRAVRTGDGELCFPYTPLDQRHVHNANLMGAWLLAEVFVETGEPRLAEQALAAARYTIHRQRDDGSWPYGDHARDNWVDNFHTGYVLVALRRIAACLETDEFDTAIGAGYRFWKARFFLPDGTPKYYPHQTYPVDVHCVAQAILTFLAFADRDPSAGGRALEIARWGIEHMQGHDGSFHYQIHRHYRIRIPFMRWSQAWVQRALVELAYQEKFQEAARADEVMKDVADRVSRLPGR